MPFYPKHIEMPNKLFLSLSLIYSQDQKQTGEISEVKNRKESIAVGGNTGGRTGECNPKEMLLSVCSFSICVMMSAEDTGPIMVGKLELNP